MGGKYGVYTKFIQICDVIHGYECSCGELYYYYCRVNYWGVRM